MTHIYVSNLCNHWFKWWLATFSLPRHYLKQYWNIVNWTLKNKLQWNFNLNLNISIKKALEIVVCEMAATLPRIQCVNNAITMIQFMDYNYFCAFKRKCVPYYDLCIFYFAHTGISSCLTINPFHHVNSPLASNGLLYLWEYWLQIHWTTQCLR